MSRIVYPASSLVFPSTSSKKSPASPNKFPGASGKVYPSGSAPVVSTPITILGAASVQQWCSMDRGVTQSGGVVSAWADQTTNANDYTEAANKPAYNASGLNGLPTMTFDGTNDKLTCAGFNPAAPGTTPVWIRAIVKLVGWTVSRTIIGAGTAGIRFFASGVTPQFRLNNGINGGLVDLTLATWFRVELLCTNSTSDYMKIGATNSTGVNTSNTANTGGRQIGCFAGANFANFEFAEILYANRNPSGAEKTALDADTTSRWGASVQL